MQNAKEFLAGDQFCNFIGVELLDIKPGAAKAKLVIKDHHLNGAGVVQGGAIFTLADLTVAAAANSHGDLALVIHSDISYIKAISKGTLYAEATEESLRSKLGTYWVKVTDETGELIASVRGMVYRKKEGLQ
jgi:acyl-CoA thioesterase